jgi:hypothetical protein
LARRGQQIPGERVQSIIPLAKARTSYSARYRTSSLAMSLAAFVLEVYDSGDLGVGRLVDAPGWTAILGVPGNRTIW